MLSVGIAVEESGSTVAKQYHKRLLCVHCMTKKFGTYVVNKDNKLRQNFFCGDCIDKYGMNDRAVHEPVRLPKCKRNRLVLYSSLSRRGGVSWDVMEGMRLWTKFTI